MGGTADLDLELPWDARVASQTRPGSFWPPLCRARGRRNHFHERKLSARPQGQCKP